METIWWNKSVYCPSLSYLSPLGAISETDLIANMTPAKIASFAPLTCLVLLPYPISRFSEHLHGFAVTRRTLYYGQGEQSQTLHCNNLCNKSRQETILQPLLGCRFKTPKFAESQNKQLTKLESFMPFGLPDWHWLWQRSSYSAPKETAVSSVPFLTSSITSWGLSIVVDFK